jgi:hypothetical protein
MLFMGQDTGFDRNCHRHTGGQNHVFWNIDKLDSDRDSLCKADPLKGRVYVLQQFVHLPGYRQDFLSINTLTYHVIIAQTIVKEGSQLFETFEIFCFKSSLYPVFPDPRSRQNWLAPQDGNLAKRQQTVRAGWFDTKRFLAKERR